MQEMGQSTFSMTTAHFLVYRMHQKTVWCAQTSRTREAETLLKRLFSVPSRVIRSSWDRMRSTSRNAQPVKSLRKAQTYGNPWIAAEIFRQQCCKSGIRPERPHLKINHLHIEQGRANLLTKG
ncbi:hypothetical protein AOLI_G00025480 [Acnodon oligacanthus]